jgi:hypothetical protein
MASYIEKFNSTIRKTQTEQILKLLNKQRSTGQIRTVEEFTTKLENLVRQLTETTIVPTMQVFEAEKKQETSSETFNFMLDRVEDDLTTGFAEAYNIDQVQRAHEAIVRDVVLKNLKHGIAELESKVGLYEFLQGDKNGFTSSIFSTFRESRDERTARAANKQVAALFTDPRTGSSTVANSEDANIDLVGERLTLGFDTKQMFDARNVVQLFDSDTITSSEAVTRPGTKVRNIVDGQKGSYWVQAVVVKNNYTALTTKLEFDLPGTKTINFVELEPANVYPFRLKKIYYYDSSNIVRLLVEPNLLISSNTAYIFPTVTTGKIILEFESFTKRRTNFQITSANQLIWQAIGNPNPSLAGLSSGFQNVQLPVSVKDVIGIPLIKNRSVQGNTFEIGFDNVRFGQGVYSNKSIYVSKPLKVNDPLQIGLKVDEKRPSAETLAQVPEMTSTTYDTEDNVLFHSSIEYWVVKRDFDRARNIVATYKMPILPTGVERVHHERLVLTERSSSSVFLPDTGYLMFFADEEISNLKFYRNGTLMPTSDWVNVTTEDNKTPNTGTRMRFKVKVKNILAGDIFTVSYSPVLSSTISVPDTLQEYSPSGISVVDVSGNLSGRVVHDQLLLVNKGPNPDTVTSSQIYMVIMLRNNTSDTSLTPAVEEYTLVIGEKDLQKFSTKAF